MTSKYQGSCLCGEVRFVITGEFEHFFLCHCEHYQKDTGSAHAANLFSSCAKLGWESGQDNIKTFNLPSTRHVISFCQECGSALPNLQMEGKLLVVPAGCLDSDLDKKPDAHLFLSSKAEWEDKLQDLPGFDRLPE